MIKSIIKRGLKKVLRPLNERLFGAQFQGVVDNKSPLLENFYNSLHRIGYLPNHIVDIGANHGTWTRHALGHFPNASVTMIEPQGWLRESVDDLLRTNIKVQFHAVGAGEKKGQFKFTIVDRDDSCSFRYSEEEAIAMGYRQVEVPVVTLNDFLAEHNLNTPDIIKIDAEGLDIDVLKGASNYFSKTEIFMVEAAVMNKMFTNDVLTMLEFMHKAGYKLFDITDINRTQKQNALWLVELVFIKRNGFIDNAVNTYA